MLYFLADLSGYFSIANVFRYITFRAGMALLTAAIFCVVVGAALARYRRRSSASFSVADPIVSSDGIAAIVLVVPFVCSTALFANPQNGYALLVVSIVVLSAIVTAHFRSYDRSSSWVSRWLSTLIMLLGCGLVAFGVKVLRSPVLDALG